jgi:hypothetical protein
MNTEKTESTEIVISGTRSLVLQSPFALFSPCRKSLPFFFATNDLLIDYTPKLHPLADAAGIHHLYIIPMTITDREAKALAMDIYELQIKGHLDDRWSDWLGGLNIQRQDDGTTVLVGPLVDQAALYGVIIRIRDLGLSLLSVSRVVESHGKIKEHI